MNATAPFRGEVYLHWNTLTNKGYVGQTSRSMEERWADHIKEHRNRALSNAIRKYGSDQFEHQILAIVGSQSQLDNLEKVWIILLQTKTPNGYNLTSGGEAGTLGYRHTPEALLKISQASQGRVVSSETRKKMAQAHIGTKMPRDGVEKTAASKRGKKQSPEIVAKRAAGTAKALTGRKLSAEHRAHIGQAQAGKKQTAERKLNTSKAMTAWWAARKAMQTCPAA